MSDQQPNAVEAEMAVLGAMLVDPEVIPTIAAILKPTDFYAHIHEPIFSAIIELHDKNQPTDKISLCTELQRLGKLVKCGGPPYISSLMDTVQTTASATHYARVVHEKSIRRALLFASREIAKAAFDESGNDVAGAIATAETVLAKAVQGYGAIETGGKVSDLLAKFYDDLQRAEEHGIYAQTTPWTRLNGAIGGWFGGELVVWFGRPKDGKSSAVGQLARHIAQSGAVAVFSLEMGDQAQLRRWLSSRAQIDSRKLRTAKLMPSDYDRLGVAIDDLNRDPIWLYGGARSISEVRRLSLAVSQPVKAIIVDHVGFLTDVQSGEKNDTENIRLQRAYTRLLYLAQELNCVVHVVTHSNRDGYEREPTLKNLRGGGNAEGIAHSVISIYRPDPENNPSDGRFIILANREGVSGSIPMHFDGARFRWGDIDNRSIA